ncbi:RNA-dependent RNA polymerase [Callinectes sapidus toti-like virus 2]|nr:RNA-dependent RNA polymerase [Callinectes sapidus toti-like virus 2]
MVRKGRREEEGYFRYVQGAMDGMTKWRDDDKDGPGGGGKSKRRQMDAPLTATRTQATDGGKPASKGGPSGKTSKRGEWPTPQQQRAGTVFAISKRVRGRRRGNEDDVVMMGLGLLRWSTGLAVQKKQLQVCETPKRPTFSADDLAAFKKRALIELLRGKEELAAAALRVMYDHDMRFDHERVLLRVLDRCLMTDESIDEEQLDLDFSKNGEDPGAPDAARLKQLKEQGMESMKMFGWHQRKYDDVQQLYMKALRRMVRAMPHTTIASLESMLYTAWVSEQGQRILRGSGLIFGGGSEVMSTEARMLMMIEVGAYKGELWEPRLQQLLGETFNKGVMADCVHVEDGLAIDSCHCSGVNFGGLELHDWMNLDQKGFFTRRSKYERQRILMYGGCPKSLVRRYGGRWAGRRRDLDSRRARKMAVEDMDCTQWELTGHKIYKWFESLSERRRAAYLAECHPGSLGPEHFAELNVSVLFQQDDEQAMATTRRRKESFDEWMSEKDRSGDQLAENVCEWIAKEWGSKTVRASEMIPSPLVGGIPIVMTAAILLEAVPAAAPLIELLHNTSGQSEEGVVCGTAFAVLSLPYPVLREFVCSTLFDEPLHEWWTTAKQHFVNVRRTLTWGDVRMDERLLMLRKILNVTIRVRGDSDIDSENFNRGCVVTRKHVWGHSVPEDGVSAYSYYEDKFTKWAGTAVAECFGKYNKEILSRSPDDFWCERAVRGANGASKRIKNVEWNDERLGNQDRPGKKALVEFLDDGALNRAMDGTPCNRAYYFVKPEPGRKLRSLYATYDEESFVAAYVSQGIENYMGASKGVMVRQTPADVIEWMAVSKSGALSAEAKDAYWLSTDYSDYNSEHTMFEMQTLDAQVATKLEEAPQSWRNVPKAAAAWWLVAAKSRSCIMYGKGKKFEDHDGLCETEKQGRWLRSVNGLYSGSRNTARDNTWIHRVSVSIAMHESPEFMDRNDFKWFALCGDDEDVAFRDELAAAGYYMTLGAVGHQLNPVKQLAGHKNHEFLQLTATREARVEKPLCSLLATLATGNWYTQLGTWIQTAPVGVIANYWELFCRGAKLQHCRRLARATLDRLMRVKKVNEDGETEEKLLEWWDYRFSVEVAPLFTMHEEDEPKNLPRFEAVAEVDKSWDNKASKAYVKKHRAMLKHLPKRIESEFVESVQGQTLGACLKTWQQKEAKRWCARHWPERENESIVEVEKRAEWKTAVPDEVRLDEVRHGYSGKKEMMTEEAVCGRMGVPFFVAKRLGGIEKLGGKVKLEQWAKACNLNAKFVPINGNAHKLQMNIRAAMTWAKTPTTRYHGDKRHFTPKKLYYAYVGNGGGKSHLVRTTRVANDLDEVWMSEFGSIREAQEAQAQRSSFGRVTKTMQQLCEKALSRNGVLVGQVDPREIKKACEVIGIEIEIVTYDPGAEVRRERMGRRGWAEDKIERRMVRCDKVYREVADDPQIKKMHDYEELRAWAYKSDSQAKMEMHRGVGTTEKILPKFVFDRTEAVTRKIELEAEDREEQGEERVEKKRSLIKERQRMRNRLRRKRRNHEARME